MLKHLLIMLLTIGLTCGCGDSVASDRGPETPEQRARENSQTAARQLAESNNQPDADGDRHWKQEARAFFDYDHHPENSTFELNADWARTFVEAAYSAGAANVWVTSISEFELGGHKLNVSDNMVVQLPSNADQRGAILSHYNEAIKAGGEEPLADIGQEYLFISGD